MDPAKLPRPCGRQVWDLLVPPEIHRDLDLGDAAPDGDAFDDMILHVDGYLCALKDAQIRGGLAHPRPAPDRRHPDRCGPRRHPAAPGSRPVAAGDRRPTASTSVERRRPKPEGRPPGPGRPPTGRGRVPAPGRGPGRHRLGRNERPTDPTLQWVAGRLVPNLPRTTDELDAPARRLWTAATCRPGRAGRRAGAGPTCCRPGATSTPSTPRPCPPRWPGRWAAGLADRLIERHVAETGRAPRTVGLVLWGTAAMRTDRRRRGRGPGPARRPAPLGRREPAGHRPGGHHRRRARSAPHRRDPADQRLLP